jgi:hypothetical protein
LKKTLKIFKSFKKAEETEIEYWQNMSGKEKLEILDTINYMQLKALYPNGKKLEKVVKIRSIYDREED